MTHTGFFWLSSLVDFLLQFWCIKLATGKLIVYAKYIHIHMYVNGHFSGLPGWADTRKVKPIWILLKQETVSGNVTSWAICKSAPRSRQISMPAPHRSVFLQVDALPATQPTASKHWRQLNTPPFNGPLPGTTQVSRCQKGKTNLEFTEARDSEWQWHQLGHMQVCTSLQADNHANAHRSVFYRMPHNQQCQSTEGNNFCRLKAVSLCYINVRQ